MVGCGAHSYVHAAAAREVAGVKLVAACDVDVARARSWAARHGAAASYGSLEAMLDGEALDGVVLCTWPNQHLAQIEACLSRGVRHVLCEKALVTSAAEARRVWALASEHDAHIVEASKHRHHPALRRLDELVAAGDVGAIDSVRASFHNYEPEEAKRGGPEATWRNRPECGGGVPYDWMHYLVDSCNHFIAGEPRRAFASGSRDSCTGVVYRIYGLVEYDNGRVAMIECSKVASFSNALQITCARAILSLPVAWAVFGEVAIVETRRQPEWPFVVEVTHPIAAANAFALQLEEFGRVVRDGVAPLVPLRDSVRNAMTTEALVTSLREGRAVDVPGL